MLKSFQMKVISLVILGWLASDWAVADEPVPAQLSDATIHAASDNGYFVSLDLGLASIDWRDVHSNISTSGRYGFSYGLSGGYRWGPHFGMEAGYFELPSVKYSGGNTSGSLTYGAFEMMSPLWKSLSAYINVGLGYRVFDDSVSGSVETTRPVLLTGLAYPLSDQWGVGMKYIYFNAHHAFPGSSNSCPDVNLVLIDLSHTF